MARKVDRFISAVEESLGYTSSVIVRRSTLSMLVYNNGIEQDTDLHKKYVDLLYALIYEDENK